MGIGKKLLMLAASLVVFNFVLWGLPKIAPEVPERYEGVSVAAPPADAGAAPPPLPAGFPSMERPPPIEVPEGQPQPIATKYGLTYDVPAGWDTAESAIVQWTGSDGTRSRYGSLGTLQRTKCSDDTHSELAMTGMTGRRTTDLDAIAREEVEKARMIFSNSDDSLGPSIVIDGPENFMISGRPAVRYTAVAENIPDAHDRCISNHATFDVVATPGYASAEAAVFMIRADRGAENALGDSEIDAVIDTIRRS